MVRQPSFRDASNLFALATAVVVVATLYIARAVLVPLALAILFTFLFAPVVTCLERIRLGRVPSAAFVLVAAISVLGAFGWTVTRQVIDVTNQLPNYRTNIRAKIASIHSSRSENLRKASDAVKQLEKDITDDPAAAKGTRAKTPPSTTQKPIPVQVVDNTSRLPPLPQLLGGFLRAGLVIVFTFFMLVQREDLRNRFIRLAGADRLTRMTQALDEAGRRVSHYLLLQLMVNITYGSIIGVVLYFIGIPNALLWGAIAVFSRFLPYVGPPLGALCPTVLAFIIFDEWTRPLITIGLFIILEVIVAYFAEPTLYGAHTGVTPIAILVAAVFWSMLWGPIGLLLSTPLTVCLVVIGRHMPHLKFLQILLGDAPALPPEARFYQRLLATDEDEARQTWRVTSRTSRCVSCMTRCSFRPCSWSSKIATGRSWTTKQRSLFSRPPRSWWRSNSSAHKLRSKRQQAMKHNSRRLRGTSRVHKQLFPQITRCCAYQPGMRLMKSAEPCWHSCCNKTAI